MTGLQVLCVNIEKDIAMMSKMSEHFSIWVNEATMLDNGKKPTPCASFLHFKSMNLIKVMRISLTPMYIFINTSINGGKSFLPL